MRFIISKTSMWSEDKPIDTAEMKATVRRHCRTCTEEHFNAKLFPQDGGKWREKGFGHHVDERGYIVRYEEHEQWCIELDTMTDLVNFIAEHGECVVSADDKSSTPEIEIYDDYRE